MYVSGTATLSSRPSVASGGICLAASPFIEKEEWKNAHAIENAFAAFSIPLFCPMLSSRAAACRPERQPNHLPLLIVVLSVSRRTCSPCHPRRAQAPCYPDQAQRAEGSAALGLLPPKKEEWKNAHAIKNAFATFSIPLFCPTLSPRASVERSDGRGRFPDSGPPDLRSE